MLRRTLGAGCLILLVSFAALAADGGKVESIGAFADQSAPEAVRKALAPNGYRITLADGGVACEVWFRATVPAGKTDASGAIYTTLPEGALIGVITFPKMMNDFRGQSIKAGTYSLRYEVHPTDGNHMGISPIRDFLLLVPVAADPNPETNLKFEELVKLSAKASGTNHPAALSLASPAAAALSVTTDEHNHTIFAAKIKTATGEMPFAFIIKGVAEQ
jgi:hypothetical protein